MKRVLLPLVAAIVAMLVVAAVAVGDSSKHGQQSLELAGTETSFAFVDAEPKQTNPETEPPSPGDSFLISEALTKHGKPFGNLYVECTFITAEATQCLATFDLPNGQMTVQGVIGDVSVFTLSVTGGTGAYFGANGSVAVDDPSEEGASSTYTFDLR